MAQTDSEIGCSDVIDSGRHAKTYYSADFSYIREKQLSIITCPFISPYGIAD